MNKHIKLKSSKQSVSKPVIKTKQNFIDSKNFNLIAIIGILLLTLIVYSKSFNNGILNWDDEEYLKKNEAIQDLKSDNIKQIFTKSFFGNYHPITSLTYAIEYKISELNPTLYHVDNLILHMINLILVFLLILLITKNKIIAFISALFFSIHPMHVESVAWISERKDLLYTLFYLASLIFYVKFINKVSNSTKFYFISLLLFCFSILSKSAAISLPFILMLIDYYYGRKFDRKAILEKIPYFIVTLFFVFLTLKTQQTEEGLGMDYSPYKIYDKLFLASYSFVFYVLEFVFPINLSALHYYPEKINGMLPIEYYLAPLIVALVVFIAFKINKNLRKDYIFGMLFFFFSIMIMLQVIPFGRAIVAERYTYVPYIGLLFFVGKYYQYLKDKVKIKNFNYISIIVLILYTSIFSYASFERVKLWKDGIALFTDAIEKTPNVPYLYYGRGCAKGTIKDYEGALSDYTKGLELKPSMELAYDLYGNRGDSKSKLNDLNGALEDFSKAIKLRPNFAGAYYNRGTIKDKVKDYKGAIEDYTNAIKYKPNYAEAYDNRGTAYMKLKDLDKAMKDFNKAIEIVPFFVMAIYNRGTAYKDLGRMDLAYKDFNKALEIDPTYVDAYINRGNSRAMQQDYKGAISDYFNAIKYTKEIKTPEDVSTSFNIYMNLGISQTLISDNNGAIESYTQAINLVNNIPDPYYKRGSAYIATGNRNGACTDWKRALDIIVQSNNPQYQQMFMEIQGMMNKFCK